MGKPYVMKILAKIQQSLTVVFFIIVTLSILNGTGIIAPFDTFETIISPDIEDKLRVKALAGNADAQNKLGTLLYKHAQKNNTDFNEAIRWFNEAHQQQHAIAQMNLGFAYKAGNGVPQSNDEAIQYFHKSGLNFFRTDFPMDAKDNVYNINQLNSTHPLKHDLMSAIRAYQDDNKR